MLDSHNNLNNRNQIFNTTVICCIIFGIFQIIPLIIPELKYGKYFLPIIILFIIITTNTKQSNIPYHSILIKLLYINAIILFFSSIIALILDSSFAERAITEIFFTISPIFCILFIQHQSNKKFTFIGLKTIFLLYIIYYITDITLLGNIQALLNININEYRSFLFNSESKGESHAGFAFGLLTLYFFANNQKKYFIATTVMVLLSSKRIVLLGILISIIFLILQKNNNLAIKKIKLIKVSILILGIIIPTLLILFANGNFDLIIDQYTGMSASQFTQGRFNLYNLIIDKFGFPNIYGTGYGSTRNYLTSIKSETAALHSDLLKLVYELGVPLYIYWLYINCKLLIFNRNSCAYYLYIFVLYISDNIYIYFDVLFIFYLTILDESYNITKRMPQNKNSNNKSLAFI